jgi:RNA-directed DNA polymerase
MQAKLHRWAGEDSSRKFGDLFNLVCDPYFLAEAWMRVSGNRGARTPGTDGVTVARVESRDGGVSGFLAEIRGLLRSGEYRPSEVRQVMIPKRNGKFRKLGIPTLADRVVQASLKLVLEPIFEADFQPCSYGFRPCRRAQDAIAEIHHLSTGTRKFHWVLEADIRACFDEIDHTALMDRFRGRIKDKRICALVKSFLKAGVMTQTGNREDSLTGTPQGGILSPLLANIALSALDEHFARQWEPDPGKRERRGKKGLGNWRICRYADDFVVMVKGTRQHAEAPARRGRRRPGTARAAARGGKDPHRPYRRGLRLPRFHHPPHAETGNEQALRLHRALPEGHPGHQGQGSGDDAQVDPGPGPRDAPPERQSVPGRVGGLFRHGVSKATFSKVDDHTWNRIMHWLKNKHHGRRRPRLPELKRRFCLPGTWTLAADGVRFTGASSVPVTRYRYRGARIPAPWAPQPAT